ncbi:MAG: SIS domain-containing protein [Erysipelotrichaceae bacterium]
MYNFEYLNKVEELIQKAHDVNEDKIKELSRVFADNIKEDRVIHTFGTGHSHMIGIELFARAGGLGNVNALLDPDSLTAFGAQRSGAAEKLPGLADVIFDSYKIEKGDIMIISSNSGRNAVPIEMAMRCQKEGVYTIALTNLEQSQATTSRHPSGKKLYEFADCILDNCVPAGDALLNIDGILTGPGSSVSSMLLLNTIVSEAMKLCVAEGVTPPVFQSQNVDGFDNDSIYKKYDGRVKHF